MPLRKQFGLVGTWEFLTVLVVCGIVMLTAGVVSFVRSTDAVSKVNAAEDSREQQTCETGNESRAAIKGAFADLAALFEAASSNPEAVREITEPFLAELEADLPQRAC